MEKIKVYLNTNKLGAEWTEGKRKRKIVEAELLEDRKTTVLVKLPNGNIIVRKKGRDLVNQKEDK